MITHVFNVDGEQLLYDNDRGVFSSEDDWLARRAEDALALFGDEVNGYFPTRGDHLLAVLRAAWPRATVEITSQPEEPRIEEGAIP